MPKTVEIWIAMDSDGDAAVSLCDEGSAVDTHNDDYGGSLPIRVVKLTVHMDPPTITEVDVAVPDEAGQTVEASAS